jgi:hypothetical protein
MTVTPHNGFARGRLPVARCVRTTRFAFCAGLISLEFVGTSAAARWLDEPRLHHPRHTHLPAESPMRFSPLHVLMAIVVPCLSVAFANAQEVSPVAERMSARRDLELAKMDLRHYWQVEYPRQKRHLHAAIELTKAEVCDLKARLREYGSFTQFSTGNAFWVTIQETRWCLREAEFRLRDLWAERNALVRFHSDQYRELELRVYEARLRVAQLEASIEQTSPPVADLPAI